MNTDSPTYIPWQTLISMTSRKYGITSGLIEFSSDGWENFSSQFPQKKSIIRFAFSPLKDSCYEGPCQLFNTLAWCEYINTTFQSKFHSIVKHGSKSSLKANHYFPIAKLALPINSYEPLLCWTLYMPHVHR